MTPSPHILPHAADSRPPEELLRYLFPYYDEASLLTLETPRDRYAASLVARAVEDADAHLLNLNVAAQEEDDGTPVVRVELRVSHRHAEAVARSLERYGFRVVAIAGQDGNDEDDSVTRERINSLLRLLNV